MEDTKDTKLEDTKDAKLEDTKDAKLEDTKDTKLEDKKDAKLEDTKDTKLKDMKDTKLEDKKDTELEDTRDTRFILSIDGGGFRGIIPAVILNEIEQRVTERIKNDHPDIDVDIRCADLFEIISGTSTGSILALGLSLPDKNKRPKFDANYIVDFYKEHGYDVFPDYSVVMSVDKLLPKLPNLTGTGYDMVKNLFGAMTLPLGHSSSTNAENNKDIAEKDESTDETKRSYFSRLLWGRSTNKKEKNNSGSKKRKNGAKEFRTLIKNEFIAKLRLKRKGNNKPDDTINDTTNDTINDKPDDTPEINNEVEFKTEFLAKLRINKKGKNKPDETSEIIISEETTNAKSDDIINATPEISTKHIVNEKSEDTIGFEELLDKNFKHNKLEDTVNGVIVIIPAYNISKCEYTLFTNYDPKFKDHYMKDVIRASASAPTYFPAKQIDSDYFIDGGVFSNNPTVKAYLEAKRKYPKSKFVVVSLGTGYYKEPLEHYKDCGVVQWIKPLINLLFNSELDNHDNTMKLLAHLDDTKYYRIQLNLNEEDSIMDKVSENDAKRLTELAHEAIKNPTYKVEEIVELLVDKCRKFHVFPTKTFRNKEYCTLNE
ncbi:1310_t:CDS:2 [Racocetra fulgida]|uniref:1310_t:CDS:1 n=1 Tax=Racocetra fulgida TaxID=60492 RepID=A0A9N8ZAF5_9GLOM|nr:1310_t:CDS:2 [Racocetra fulgida]